MDNEQRIELVKKIEKEIGIEKIFKDLGLEQVTKSGNNIYCVCPFHEGADNPTGFSWNTNKGFGYCFTHCHKSFSLFDVVMKFQDCTFPESVSYLADLADYDINWSISKKHDGSDNKAFIAQVKKANQLKFDIEVEPFDSAILNTFAPNMHRKLREEGFNNEIRDYFGLGYCSSGYLENRITIPIDSYNGEIITVSGRSVLSDEEIEFVNVRKYLIYYDTDKAKTLYNISRAMPYIELLGEVIVVEGFKSVWRLHQWGIRNVVAVMGSTISNEQLLLLLKMNAKIIVCGDRDEAGNKLNKEVANGAKRFSDVAVMDMYLLNVPEKSSIAELTELQYGYLYNNRKEVV